LQDGKHRHRQLLNLESRILNSSRLRNFLVSTFVVLALAFEAPRLFGAAKPEPPRPSILLITIDTLRADHVGCYGYKQVETPVIDGLAAEGVRFENAYAQVPLTLPSHVVILTGTYPMFNGVRDFTTCGLRDGILTIAEILKRRGYRTAAFISSFALNSMWGLNRGFDVYDDNLGVEPGRAADVFLDERRGDRTVDRFLDWIGRPSAQPFFVWLHLYDPHSPYWPPEPYLTKYAGHPYDGEIAFDDAQAGRVLARLKALRLYDRTAIVLLSDHGESLGEHGEDEHGFFIYNATLRVPLIVKLPSSAIPSVRSGQALSAAREQITGVLRSAQDDERKISDVVGQPVGTVDVAPTIAQLCGIPAAEARSFQGRSLLRLLATGSATDNSAVYAESFYPRDSFGWHALRAVVDSRFKYIDAPRPELYDLERDPAEQTNLAAVNTSVAASLRERLEGFESRYRGKAASPTQLDPEAVERLRSLGYVSFQSPAAPGADAGRADPKDKIETLRAILRAGDLRRAGRHAEAEDLLAQLERTEPDLYVIPFERGENYLGWSRPQEALKEFGKALELNPSFDQAALGLGRAHFMLGDDRRAATAFQLALHSNPHNFLAREALAKVFWREDLPAKAEPELAQVVKEHPELIEARADYAVILAKLQRYREALPHFQRALAMEYRQPIFFNYLGITYAQLGEPPKAIDAYQQAVAMDPRYAVAYLNLALQYQQQGQPVKARTYYQKTCALSAELCRQYAGKFEHR